MTLDLHTHGLAGPDSHSTDPDEYLALAESYKSHGTDAFLPTLFPAPIDVMRAQMKAIKTASELQSINRLERFIKIGERDKHLCASIVGVHLEGPFVNPAKCGALDSGSFLQPDNYSLLRLVEGFEGFIKIITVAPELPGALALIEKAAELGIRVNMGHSAATFEQAKAGRAAGATGVTHLFNAMSGMHHREPGLAGYALSDDRLYVEIIADFAHVHPEMVKLVLRIKPPSRIILVSDSLSAAKTPGAPDMGPLYLEDGRTLAGSGITLADAVKNIVSLGVPEETASSFAGVNPRRFLENTPN